ncbi:hypothetical protein BOTNAR_0374g00040 [Botryotinia narcissicola]|uniref:Zn(2)-C6 fungal-type domain-containing protein n=1 Tax=Botryotinia narcissicola TaxID=278944 RepID=A0A4Z1HPX2_9HELO|nr:hypothetical protein BOTNAR_0374g00040 [Botryotinia narcissicola]
MQFSRLDTARRHVKRCSPDGVGSSATEPSRTEPSRRGKLPQACDVCAQRKLSCNTSLPCIRCVSSNVECTYQRRIFPDPIPPNDLPLEDPSPAGNVEADSDASRGKIPIQFLLSFTTPAEHEATTAIISASRDQLIEQAASTHLLSSCTSEFNFGAYDALFWDQEDWTPDFVHYLNQEFHDDTHRNRKSSTQGQASSVIEIRLAHMCQQLASTQRILLAENPDYHDDFEESLAEIFTTTNFETFVQAYFLHLHQFYPIVHRPSFDCETACLPLLLAIFLFGSLCSAPSDSTLSARKVFDVAEEYIFNHPTMQQLHHSNSTCVSPEETIGVLQAAFIIEVVQNGTNNVETRRRLRIKRHPWYIAALRSYELFQVSGIHSLDDSITGQSKWQSFYSQEIRTRCPLLTLWELSINFPCRNDIFEAETAAEYEHLAMFDSPELRWKTPSQLIKDLLQDTWTNSSRGHVTAMHLMVTICALQSLVMTLRCSLVLEATGAAILRAADRWEDLWRTVTEGSKTRTMTGQGFV